MKRGLWVVAVLLAWMGCGSSGSGGEAAPDGAAPGVPDAAAPGVPDAAAMQVTGTVDAASDSMIDVGAAVPDGAVAGAGPSTWTRIYGDLFGNGSYVSSCAGALCHDPGKEKGVDLSSAAKGYTTLQPRIVPGAPDSSTLYTDLVSGRMPRAKPRMAPADLARVRAWIQAGAPND